MTGACGTLTEEGRSVEPSSFLGESVSTAAFKCCARELLATTVDGALDAEVTLLCSISTARSVAF